MYKRQTIYSSKCVYSFRSITMVWVALGHFYMIGTFYPIFGSPVMLRNKGDAEKVSKTKHRK